jgi:hypothetical protein
MKKLALIAALLLAASPAAAQVATSGQQQLLGGQAPTTGIFCDEEMTATFCNLPTGPNTSGYGSSGVSTSSSGVGSSSGPDLVTEIRGPRRLGLKLKVYCSRHHPYSGSRDETRPVRTERRRWQHQPVHPAMRERTAV